MTFSTRRKPDLTPTESLIFTKDTGDFFVQCDKCLVWQHGGCMGFHDEAILPEEYYCELCKPKLHKIQKTPEGYVASPQKVTCRLTMF